MTSKAWKKKKAKYWKSKYSKNCYVCGKARHVGMHLHHRTYVRLGNERLSDLVPVCSSCHHFIHKYQQETGLPIEEATRRCKDKLKGKRIKRLS